MTRHPLRGDSLQLTLLGGQPLLNQRFSDGRNWNAI